MRSNGLLETFKISLGDPQSWKTEATYDISKHSNISVYNSYSGVQENLMEISNRNFCTFQFNASSYHIIYFCEF